ncbi:uncharacterized protein LOC135494689 [Lineus longissimus]|uniref:uncharacterized protein LOC135494689 n=1 Tax=Lineus longissimus TaxID=88925 RepID=UPI002B4CDCF1
MNNYMLIGVNNFTNFNLRLCLGVLTFFTVLTVISYVAEVDKYGTYWGWFSSVAPKRFRRSFHNKEITVHFVSSTTINYENVTLYGTTKDARKNSRALPTKGQEETTALFRSFAGLNRRRNGEKEKHVEALNVGRKAFVRNHNSKPTTSASYDTSTSTRFSRNEENLKSHEIHSRIVFHINDPIIIPFRDCLQRSDQMRMKLRQKLRQRDHRLRDFPISASKRLIFNIPVQKSLCEESSKLCTRYFLVSHPVRYLMTLFQLCKKNTSLPEICQKEHFHSNMTFYDFSRTHDNVLFRNLLVQTDVCRKKAEDDICAVPPNKKQRFGKDTYKRYLDLVIHYITGFKGGGLMEHPQITMLLFQKFLGRNITECKGLSGKLLDDGNIRWKHLLNDAKLMKFFEADLIIYKKFEEIFLIHRQGLLNSTNTGGGQLLKPTSEPFYH